MTYIISFEKWTYMSFAVVDQELWLLFKHTPLAVIHPLSYPPGSSMKDFFNSVLSIYQGCITIKQILFPENNRTDCVPVFQRQIDIHEQFSIISAHDLQLRSQVLLSYALSNNTSKLYDAFHLFCQVYHSRPVIC